MEGGEQRESIFSRVASRVTSTAGEVIRGMARQPELVPLDKMDDKSICNGVRIVLVSQSTMVNPDDAKFIYFNLHNLADALGHQNAIDDPEKIGEYEQVRGRIRRTVDQLIKDEILEDASSEQPDADGETIFYGLKRDENGSIEDANQRLIEIAEGRRQLEPQAA